ncbi:MAG TPA: hypothetical protein VGL91_04650, partial [Acidobacteriota bacterium]
HPEMAAIILVLPTPFITEGDIHGNYRLDLPPGQYRLTAWSERSQSATTEIKVAGGAVSVPDLVLDESEFVGMPHKNKFGQDYPGTIYDPLKGEKNKH